MRARFVGTENVPPDGQACLLATNHMSRLDLPLIYVTPGRTDITGLVTTKYQRYPFFRWIVESAECIWLDRDIADFGAVRLAVEVLKTRGAALGIAPEGTRSSSGKLIEAKFGVALVAEKARVPVVPVAIAGTESASQKLFVLGRPKVTLSYGQPFLLPPIDPRDRQGSLRRNTDEIMCRIAALLPEKYHGFYAGHPRLLELLGEKRVENRESRAVRPSTSEGVAD